MYKKKILKEFPMDYSEIPGSEPHKDIETKITKKQTPFSANPALPKVKGDKFDSFEELIASKAFKTAVKNLEKYTGEKANPSNVFSLVQLGLKGINKITTLEKDHKEELEQLAVKLVMQEMGI